LGIKVSVGAMELDGWRQRIVSTKDRYDRTGIDLCLLFCAIWIYEFLSVVAVINTDKATNFKRTRDMFPEYDIKTP